MLHFLQFQLLNVNECLLFSTDTVNDLLPPLALDPIYWPGLQVEVAAAAKE